MGVFIKGMEMPERCGQCFLRVGNCKQRIYMERRPKGCPLVQVETPHGRLIDADALYTRMEKAHIDWIEHPEQYNGVIPVNADEIFVLTEAVIIPAEEGE